MQTWVYSYCTPGSTNRVHGGVQSLYIRVEMKFAHLQNKSQKRAYEKPYIQAINSYILVRNHCKKIGDTW